MNSGSKGERFWKPRQEKDPRTPQKRPAAKLTARPAFPRLAGMEVHFTPDTEAQLKQLAASKGKDAAQLVEQAVNTMLERRARFIKGVENGIAAADRGDLIEHDEVVNRIDRLFQS